MVNPNLLLLDIRFATRAQPPPVRIKVMLAHVMVWRVSV